VQGIEIACGSIWCYTFGHLAILLNEMGIY